MYVFPTNNISTFDIQGFDLVKKLFIAFFIIKEKEPKELILNMRYDIKKKFLSHKSGISLFFKSTSTSLFTGSTFYQNLNNFS